MAFLARSLIVANLMWLAGQSLSSSALQAQVAGTAANTLYASTECELAGGKWKDELNNQVGRPRGAFTMLVFLEGSSSGDASVCYYNREYGVVGDPIYVAVFTLDPTSWTAARFEPCALQSAAPNVLRSVEKFPVATITVTEKKWRLQTFLPRRCFNTAVDLSIHTQTIAQRYPLTQYDRYRATLQAGILFTKLHDRSFGLRRDQSDTSKAFIFDRGPSNRGPEYIATLNLYSVFKYLPSLLGRYSGAGPYRGRDPVNDHDLLDRIGAVLGVAITNPTSRFTAGVSFELIYGVNAIWVTDFARVKRLAKGIDIDQPFKGTEAQIPTITVWKQRPSLGLSIDLRYLSLLLTGNRP